VVKSFQSLGFQKNDDGRQKKFPSKRNQTHAHEIDICDRKFDNIINNNYLFIY